MLYKVHNLQPSYFGGGVDVGSFWVEGSGQIKIHSNELMLSYQKLDLYKHTHIYLHNIYIYIYIYVYELILGLPDDGISLPRNFNANFPAPGGADWQLGLPVWGLQESVRV